MKDSTAVDPLIRAFTTGNTDLCKYSVIALGKIGSKRAVATIIAAAGDGNYEVRLGAIQAMGSIGDTRVLPALLSFFHDPNLTVRMETVQALGSYPGTEAMDLLIQALQDPDVGIRKEAARLLGICNAVAAARPLTTLLDDPDTEVRLAAARALDAIGWKPADAKEQLAYLIAKENWKEIRRLGLISNSSPKPQNAKPALVPKDLRSRIPREPGVAEQEKALSGEKTRTEMLSEVKEASPTTDDNVPDLQYFIGALADLHADPSLRHKAAEALGRLGDLRGIQPLMNALGDPDAEVRWRAALSLGMLGDHRVFSSLVVALDDPVFEVKRRAAESIAVLKPRGAVRPLCELTKSPDPGSRSLAVKTLGEFEDDEAIRALLSALEDTHADVKSAARSSLMKRADYWGSHASVFLKDEEQVIRRNAIGALKTLLGEEKAMSQLVPLLRSGSFSVRREVLSTLEQSGWQPRLPEEYATVLIVDKQWDDVVALGKPATGALIEALFDTDREIQEGAITSLEKTGDSETVQAIKAVLRRRSDLQVKGVYAAMKVISLIHEKDQRNSGAGREEDESSSHAAS